MVVGILTVRLAIFESTSLKDKRRVVKSLKDRLAGRHNVSIAEVDDLDHRQAATLGLAMISNDAAFVRSCLQKIADELRAYPHATLVHADIELV